MYQPNQENPVDTLPLLQELNVGRRRRCLMSSRSQRTMAKKTRSHMTVGGPSGDNVRALMV